MQYPLRFTWSLALEEFFQRSSVFLAHPNKVSGIFKPGESLSLASAVEFEPYATMPRRGFMSMGAFSYSISGLNDSTKVGRYCSISWGCAVLGIEHPTERITTHLMSFREAWASDMTRRRGGAPTPAPFKSWLGPVTIGNDVWIGQDVRLRAGLTIGDGAVLASGSIVLKDVPSFAIVGGVPAKLIRYRLPEEVRARAASIRWWDYAPESFAGLSTEHPAAFLDGLERRIADGLQPYRPDKIDLGATVLAIDAAP